MISLQQWSKNYEKLFNEDRQKFMNQCTLNTNHINTTQINVITALEVYTAITKVKNGKSAGPGETPIKLLKKT